MTVAIVTAAEIYATFERDVLGQQTDLTESDRVAIKATFYAGMLATTALIADALGRGDPDVLQRLNDECGDTVDEMASGSIPLNLHLQGRVI